jgi:hypothetical protein
MSTLTFVLAARTVELVGQTRKERPLALSESQLTLDSACLDDGRCGMNVITAPRTVSTGDPRHLNKD